MVVYGEGAYRCATHGAVRPGQRTADALARGEFEPPCPECGQTLDPATIDEDAPLDPRNTYAATKLHTEHLATVYGREAGAPVVALRYHNVFGDRMPSRHALRRGRLHLPHGAGSGPGAPGVRGRRPAPRLRARQRRRPGQRAGAHRRTRGDGRLQHRLGRPPHRGRPGRRPCRRLRSAGPAARGHRRVAPRRCPPCDRLAGPSRAVPGVPRDARVPARGSRPSPPQTLRRPPRRA